MRIFLAAPFFSYGERKVNVEIAEFLRDQGFNVWMAQENPFLKTGDTKEKERIFRMDLEALRESDVVVAILDGECIDSGTAFELGYAFALGKKIIGLKTDYRTFSPLEELNLMIEMAVTLIRSPDINQIKKKLLEVILGDKHREGN